MSRKKVIAQPAVKKKNAKNMVGREEYLTAFKKLVDIYVRFWLDVSCGETSVLEFNGSEQAQYMHKLLVEGLEGNSKTWHWDKSLSASYNWDTTPEAERPLYNEADVLAYECYRYLKQEATTQGFRIVDFGLTLEHHEWFEINPHFKLAPNEVVEPWVDSV